MAALQTSAITSQRCHEPPAASVTTGALISMITIMIRIESPNRPHAVACSSGRMSSTSSE